MQFTIKVKSALKNHPLAKGVVIGADVQQNTVSLNVDTGFSNATVHMTPSEARETAYSILDQLVGLAEERHV